MRRYEVVLCFPEKEQEEGEVEATEEGELSEEEEGRSVYLCVLQHVTWGNTLTLVMF